MRTRLLLAALAAVGFSTTTAAQDQLPPGIWTNTEDEYFAEEEGRTRPKWVAFEVNDDRRWRTINAFGVAQSEWSSDPIPALSKREDDGWQVDGSELRRAVPFSCWVAVRKFAAKPDGSEDWTFQRNLPSFDQGGRVFVAGDGVAPDVTIRLRNVTWAKGSSNKPVRVLYVHKDDPVRAESYSWGAPTTEMVGINLRWVQASCSETPTEIEGI